MEPKLLAGWTDFYVIVGSSAGALTGLQFVVMTLIADAGVHSSMQEVRTFATPTIVQFCTALLISAIVSAPWHAVSPVAALLVACGVAGVAYAAGIIRNARTTKYAPDLEDWIWYATLPLIAYAVLIAGAITLWLHPRTALYIIAAVTLVFLFIGIHNAWDSVTYIAMGRHRTRAKGESAP